MRQFIAVLGLSVGLPILCLLIHYEVLRGISSLLPRLSLPPRPRILIVLCVALVGHLIEIAAYAAGFFFVLEGNVANVTSETLFEQSVYISMESFASLGTSSGFPIGSLRMLAGSEALAGLILIGWTTSYTYLAMRELWNIH